MADRVNSVASTFSLLDVISQDLSSDSSWSEENLYDSVVDCNEADSAEQDSFRDLKDHSHLHHHDHGGDDVSAERRRCDSDLLGRKDESVEVQFHDEQHANEEGANNCWSNQSDERSGEILETSPDGVHDSQSDGETIITVESKEQLEQADHPGGYQSEDGQGGGQDDPQSERQQRDEYEGDKRSLEVDQCRGGHTPEGKADDKTEGTCAEKQREGQVIEEKGAKEKPRKVHEVNLVSPQKGSDRLIMIDGMKFNASTSQHPPRGICRACSCFGALLYFSARPRPILEVAEKFCSVPCVRRFISEKQVSTSHHRDLLKIKVPEKRGHPKITRKNDSQKNAGLKHVVELARKTSSASKNSASGKVDTVCDIYLNSLIVNKNWGRSTKQRKKSGKGRRGRCRSLTSLRRKNETVFRQSKSETAITARSRGTMPDKMLEDIVNIKRDAISACGEESGKAVAAAKEPKQKLSAPVDESLDTPPPVVKQIFFPGNPCNQNHKRDRPGEQKKKKLLFPPISSTVWKSDLSNISKTRVSSPCEKKLQREGTARQCSKEASLKVTNRGCPKTVLPSVTKVATQNIPSKEGGGKLKLRISKEPAQPKSSHSTTPKSRMKTRFRSRSCEFVKENTTSGFAREFSTPQPTSKGLKLASVKKNIDDGKSLDVRASLGQFHERRRSQFKTLFPFQESLLLEGVSGPGPAANSASDSRSLVGVVGEETPSQESIVEEGGDVPTMTSHQTAKYNQAETGTSSKPHRKRSGKKTNSGNKDGSKSHWTNLLRIMIEAADREDDEYWESCGEIPTTSSRLTEGKHAGLEDSKKSDGCSDGMTREERRKKKKKKKKKKKNREKDFLQDASVLASASAETDASRQSGKKRKKDKKKKHRDRQVKGTTPSPAITPDPNAWPKWKGKPEVNMDTMTDVDHLIWTMENEFEPTIGQPANLVVEHHLPIDTLDHE